MYIFISVCVHGPFTTGQLQKQSHKAGSLGVQVEGTQEYYKKCIFSQREHVAPMMLLHKTGMLLQGLEIPRNNHEWLQSMQQATKTTHAWGIPTPAYHWPWLVRTHMMVEMRHTKIDGLQVTMDWDTVTVAEAMLPDQSTWGLRHGCIISPRASLKRSCMC